MKNLNRNVPKATLQRYPIYLKALRQLQSEGMQRILSQELSNYVQIKSTTIRRDLSFLGSLGKQGYGYSIEKLIAIFNDKLGSNFDEKIILIGAGNLGRALLNYNHWNHVVGEIVCAFDLKPENVKSSMVPVYNIKDLAEKMPQGCRIAILCINQNVQETVDLLVSQGIKGFVSFSLEHFSVPQGVYVRSVDVVSSIQELVFETNSMKG